MRLRVIAGELGGRFFQAPTGFVTHPMGERMRGALFNKLGNIGGTTVLDAFAGSGALSFEAISRGAASAVMIERDKNAQRTIARNIEQLAITDRTKLIAASTYAWSQTDNAYFDIIFCDPPYNNLHLSTVQALVNHMKPKGLMVLSYPGRESAPTVNGVVVVDKSSYGDAALAIYRNQNSQRAVF